MPATLYISKLRIFGVESLRFSEWAIENRFREQILKSEPTDELPGFAERSDRIHPKRNPSARGEQHGIVGI